MARFDGYAPLERTLVILKPDAVERKHVDAILARLNRAGLKILTIKQIRASEAELDNHFPSSYEDVRAMGVRAEERCWKEMKLDPLKRGVPTILSRLEIKSYRVVESIIVQGLLSFLSLKGMERLRRGESL